MYATGLMITGLVIAAVALPGMAMEDGKTCTATAPVITRTELSSLPQWHPALPWFDALDADHDGTLTEAEMGTDDQDYRIHARA